MPAYLVKVIVVAESSADAQEFIKQHIACSDGDMQACLHDDEPIEAKFYVK